MSGAERDLKPEKVRVYILAGNRLLREALGNIVKRAGFEVVGSSEPPGLAAKNLSDSPPSVLVIHGGMLESECPSIILDARSVAPGIPIVLLGAREDPETFFRSIQAGIAAYISSEGGASDLVAAIRCAVRGESLCPPRLCRELFKYVAEHASASQAGRRRNYSFTRRERQLLPLISEGLTNKEIAARLIISELTVKNHVGRILRKTGTRDRFSAAQAAHDSPLHF
ncbi:MAG: LuxR C-terminal-related transcriptional regulator [Candidatus Acidiferrales bacterium]